MTVATLVCAQSGREKGMGAEVGAGEGERGGWVRAGYDTYIGEIKVNT